MADFANIDPVTSLTRVGSVTSPVAHIGPDSVAPFFFFDFATIDPVTPLARVGSVTSLAQISPDSVTPVSKLTTASFPDYFEVSMMSLSPSLVLSNSTTSPSTRSKLQLPPSHANHLLGLLPCREFATDLAVLVERFLRGWTCWKLLYRLKI